MRGKCKWFNSEKGFGFIGAEDGRDIFCHYSSILMEGRKDLHEGDEVEFEVEMNDKGPRARNVVVLIKSEEAV